MLPIVHLFVKFEAVVELVHLDFFWVVAREDLSVDPAVGQVALRVGDLVREVERLDPLGHLARQR